jgi:hypothetical protein
MWRPILAILALVLLPAAAGADPTQTGEQFDRSVHDSCVSTAAPRTGAAPAERYCSCVVGRLDLLPISQRLQITPNSDKLVEAETYCNAVVAGQDPNGAVFDKGVHDACVSTAAGNGATPATAEGYCSCVVRQLDRTPVSARLQLTPSSRAVTNAEATCNAEASRRH